MCTLNNLNKYINNLLCAEPCAKHCKGYSDKRDAAFKELQFLAGNLTFKNNFSKEDSN